MSEHDEKVLNERCENCGCRLKQYPVVRPDGDVIGHEVGCPEYIRRVMD